MDSEQMAQHAQMIREMFEGGGFGFNFPFGNMGGRPKKRGPVKGADIQTQMRLSFSEAVNGCTKNIVVTRQDTCGTCTGTGNKPGTPVVKCKQCSGSGLKSMSQGMFEIQMPCNTCKGQGETRTPCSTCKGNGTVKETKTVSVTVPAGVDSNTNLRLRDQGDAGKAGGTKGHLWVKVAVDSDSNFLREGPDVHQVIPISIGTALLGGEVKVNTVRGAVTIKVDPGTQSGDKRCFAAKASSSLAEIRLVITMYISKWKYQRL